MKRIIRAASVENEALGELLDGVESDFDYLISGLEKLDRDGAHNADAMDIANKLSNGIQSCIEDIADLLNE